MYILCDWDLQTARQYKMGLGLNLNKTGREVIGLYPRTLAPGEHIKIITDV